MQKFNLDISIKRVIPLLYVKQRDVGTKILVEITNNGDAYAIPADASLSVWYSGASGEGNYTTIGENSAFSIDGNTVTVELIMQMLNNPGDGKMCLVLNGSDGIQLGLWDIPYFVEAIPGADSDAAQVYYSAFHEYAVKTIDAAERASAAAEALEGGLVLKKGEGADSLAQVNASGNDNVAFAPMGAAFGMGTTSGVKGFYMLSVDAENMLITVDDAGLSEKAAEVYTVGDVLNFDATKHYYNILKIKSLSTNQNGQSVIGINYSGTAALDLVLEKESAENYCWVVSKHYGKTIPLTKASFAEGEQTQACGRDAHAEGRRTQAIGNYSHAEGRNTKAGYCCHAEGSYTQALAHCTHTEGSNTVATADCGHAEGEDTKAMAECSHSEGRGTRALGKDQHVQGRYNSYSNYDKYAHIVGNGTSDKDRKNIHTLDWNGNAMFAGTHITVGGQALTAETIGDIATKAYLKSYIEEYIDSLGVAEGRQF